MRVVLAVILAVEALAGVQTLARFVTLAPAYDALVWLMTGLRGVVTLLQGLAAWLLVRREPPAPVFARTAVLSAAALLTLELGAHLAPSSLPPGSRGPLLAIYWIYAVLALLVLRPSRSV